MAIGETMFACHLLPIVRGIRLVEHLYQRYRLIMKYDGLNLETLCRCSLPQKHVKPADFEFCTSLVDGNTRPKFQLALKYKRTDSSSSGASRNPVTTLNCSDQHIYKNVSTSHKALGFEMITVYSSDPGRMPPRSIKLSHSSACSLRKHLTRKLCPYNVSTYIYSIG